MSGAMPAGMHDQDALEAAIAESLGLGGSPDSSQEYHGPGLDGAALPPEAGVSFANIARMGFAATGPKLSPGAPEMSGCPCACNTGMFFLSRSWLYNFLCKLALLDAQASRPRQAVSLSMHAATGFCTHDLLCVWSARYLLDLLLLVACMCQVVMMLHSPWRSLDPIREGET